MSDTNESNGDLYAITIIENFGGTTVPKKALFDHLAEGGNLDSFVATYPAVPRDKAEMILIDTEMKRKELIKAGRQPESLYAAYLERINEPPDLEFYQAVMAMTAVADDPAEFQRVSKARGFRTFTEDEFEAFVQSCVREGSGEKTS